MQKENQNAVLNIVPSNSDCFAELGTFAGAIYANRVFTYLRQVAFNQREILTVANGLIVEHYFTSASGKDRRESEVWLGDWALGLKLTRGEGFIILRSQSLGSWFDEIKSASQSSSFGKSKEGV